MHSTAAAVSAGSYRPLGSMLDGAIWVLWHLASAACIPLLLSELRIELPFWEMSYQVRAFLASTGIAHLIAAAVVTVLAMRRGRIGIPSVFVASIATYAVLFGVQQVLGIGYSRSVLIMAAMASAVLLTVSLELRPRLYKVLLPALVVVAIVTGRVAFAGWPADDGVSPTVFYQIRLVDTKVTVPSPVRGGAMAAIGDSVVIVNGDGAFFTLRGEPAVLTRLPYDVPFNRAEYLSSKTQSVYPLDPFRVAGLLLTEYGDRLSVFASHHYWRRDEGCVVVRVSKAEAGRDEFLSGGAKLQWQTAFETSPCMRTGELKMEQIGGRMVLLDEQTMLLSVGDLGQDGVSAKAMVPQDPSFQYGKTLRIDLATGKAEVFTLGHRNPQGLARAADGTLWLTEQGPGGGDELNLLKPGVDYGWPKVTYGTEYDELTWPLNAADNRHDGFQMPAFAWVPSLATTAVVSITKDRFPVWKNDLVVATLKGRLLRLRVDGERIVFAEPLLETKMRMRDVIEAPDGRFYILQDDGHVSYVEPITELPPGTRLGPPRARGDALTDTSQTAHPGAALYRSCQVCHRSGADDAGAGPDLRGVVGRSVASVSNYGYSPAMQSLSGSWTPERLSSFLENPQAFAPGTTMQTEGIDDAEARRQLVEYLAMRK